MSESDRRERLRERLIEGSVARSDARHRPTSWPRMVLAGLVVLVFVVGAFVGATLLAEVPRNESALHAACVEGNKRLESINVKFAQLVALFDAIGEDPEPDDDPPSPEVLALYAEFRKPIPLRDCSEVP